MMNVISWFSWLVSSLADWYWPLQFVSLVLIAGTVLVGGLAIISGRESNRRQVERVIALETDLANAKAKQAEAELALQKRVDEVKRMATARDLSFIDFEAALKDKPKGSIEFQYKVGDAEAFKFALQLMVAFQDVGWKVKYPVEHKEGETKAPKFLPEVPSGVSIVWEFKDFPPTRKSDPMPYGLMDVFKSVGLNTNLMPARFTPRPDKPDIIILVGARV
ncbi:MAG: hypothetical protein M3539_07210 [Acidobacteriota bacterium]|nr:hypothetical protein [Acidobacteriota bacterium]